MPVRAVAASAAHGIERQDHFVAGLQPVDALANFCNCAGTFMSEDHRAYEVFGVPIYGVVIGVANAGADHFEQDFASFGRINLQHLD